jgi:YegS/Rv2252/BmrU family lipid kinase
MALRIALIVRPRGRDPRLEELRAAVARLRAAGHRVRPRLTYEVGDARRFARAAALARCDLVLAAGGDGTVNEVVNGIASSSWQPRLGVVPVGTANDFASDLGLPRVVAEAVDVALRGRPIALDAARLNRRYFVNVSTGGFGADATVGANPEAKQRLGPVAYLLAGAKQFVGLKRRRACFLVDGQPLHEGEFMVFAVGNARRTGGGTLLTPLAHHADRKLDVVVVRGMSRLDFLALMPDLRAGTHLDSPDVFYARATELRVEADRSLRVNADGEALRARTLVYRIADRPLSVMVPL